MNTGERIRELRLSKGLSQAELGNLVGVQNAAIYKYEHGIIENVPKERIKALATVLNTTTAYLLCLIDDPNPNLDYNELIKREVLRNEELIAEVQDGLTEFLCSTFRERLAYYLSTVDCADLAERFGTSSPFEDVIAGITPWTWKKATEIADDCDLPLEWLCGFNDDPSDDTSLAAKSIIKRWKSELTDNAADIETRMSVQIKRAQQTLVEKVMEICKNPNTLDKARQLHDLELVPARIDLVTDFIQQNAVFLKRNMPGIPPDTENELKE